jgi:lipoate-protein ligase B
VRGGIWHDLGRLAYPEALAVQHRIADERARGLRPDTLLLLEHPATVTLGRRAADRDVVWSGARLAQSQIAVERVGRGGGATYHGPGQLVGYPIVAISHHGRGVRQFVDDLESVLVEATRNRGVAAERRPGRPGVFVAGRKLASIGIEVRRGVSRHGFAWNVDIDLRPFEAIVPCCDPDLRMTDLSREAATRITIAEAREALLGAWQSRFGKFEEETLDELEAHG